MHVKDNLAKAYCIKRDAAVLAAVLDGNIEPLKQIGTMLGKPFPTDEVAWVTAHKMCVAIMSMPDNLRAQSRSWLREHGFREEIA